MKHIKDRQISMLTGKLDKRVRMLTNSCTRKMDAVGTRIKVANISVSTCKKTERT